MKKVEIKRYLPTLLFCTIMGILLAGLVGMSGYITPLECLWVGAISGFITGAIMIFIIILEERTPNDDNDCDDDDCGI